MAAVFGDINSGDHIRYNVSINNDGAAVLAYRCKNPAASLDSEAKRVFVFQSGVGTGPSTGVFVASSQATNRGHRWFASRNLAGNFYMHLGGASLYDDEFHNYGFSRGATPAATHLGAIDGSTETPDLVNASNLYDSTANNVGYVAAANFGGGVTQSLDGSIEWLYYWAGITATQDQLNAITAGVHPALLGLGNPTFAVELPDEIITLSGQNLVSSQVSSYESNAGSYLYYPVDLDIDEITAVPPTEVQYNLGKHKLQALPITIGAGVGV